MSPYKNKLNYSKTAKLLHWGFIIIFVYGISKQVNNIDQLKDIYFFRFEITFAFVFLILLLVRFIYMKKTQKTSLPEETPKIQKIAAKIIHNGMYLLLFATVLSGLTIGFLYWLDSKDSYLIKIIINIHEFVINLLYLFIAIHILAAIYHRLKKDGVWNSMVPFFREK
ncbi:cytochrome b/b6 domain-containing protein [Pelagibacteraceae bacterium]|nr:cytochrome b/b6 domain-containing protein [Pelagibacteraceae bacterium]